MMGDRISYDGAEVVRMLEAGLDKLNPIRYDSKYKGLLGERVIEKLNHWDRVIRQQKNEPITIVVCGEFKRGKSSLINALLGEEVVTTDITTETITINKVCYGPHSNEIVLSGGKRILLRDEELKSEKLREILKSSDGARQLVLKRPNEFLKKATIIDTPGLGDSLADFTDDVAQALRMADAVIYVFSVAYPISTQEQFFIKTCILPQKYTDFILVGNYSDMIDSEEDYQRSKEVVCRRISDILPQAEPVLVSALDERSRQIEKPRPNPDLAPLLEAAFRELRDKLSLLLEDKRDFVIPDRVQRLTLAMLEDIKKETDAIEQGLTTDAEQAREQLKNSEKRKEEMVSEQQKILDLIDKRCDVHRADSVKWIEALLNLLEADTDTLLTKVTTDDIKRFYTLFCVETLQKAFEKCSEHYLSEIYHDLSDVSPELTKQFSFNSATISPKFIFEVNNNTYTAGDQVAFIGSAVESQLGTGFLSFITNYVGGTMREKEIEKKSPDYIASIKQQLSQLHLSVVPALSKEYRNISDQAKEQILAFFDNELQEMEHTVAQTVSVSGRDAETKEEIRSAIDYLNAILLDLSHTFD
ncbi:dynamin family protein [Ruminococcus sp.]|uniref:dynamin family protein n=1 Tax=Ruminococcus sp. TaxID=41978 RepID=UPI00388E99F1